MLQKSVSLYPSEGFPGQEVNLGQAVYTPENFLSDGTCQAGAFAFRKTSTDTSTAVKFGLASLTGTAGSVPLGLVERNITSTCAINADEDELNTFSEGEGINIAIRGDFWIEAPAAAAIGQAVLCDPATGAITFGAVGATSDTGWVVQSAGAKGEMVIISNHGIGIQPAKASA